MLRRRLLLRRRVLDASSAEGTRLRIFFGFLGCLASILVSLCAYRFFSLADMILKALLSHELRHRRFCDNQVFDVRTAPEFSLVPQV